MRNQLTRDGMKIAPIVFGTSCLGNLYRELPFAVKKEIVAEWFKCVGTPTIDTAGKYGAGMALECIGQALRELEIPRDRIIISNKLGWRRMPLTAPEPTFEPGIWQNIGCDARQDISYKGIIHCYEEGLKLLGSGYDFDLLSVHDPDDFLSQGGSERDIQEAYRALFELKAAGKTKAVGVGAKNWRVIRALYRKIKFDWVMFACAPTILNHPLELLEFIRTLESDGVGIINSAVFNGGFLTGGEYYDYRPIDPFKDRELLRKREIFRRICDEYAVSPAAAAVEFGMRISGVTATALNTSSPARIAENVSFVTHRSPEEFWETLELNGIINYETNRCAPALLAVQ